MPHLSPMSWTFILPLMWLSLSFLVAHNFYTLTVQFPITNTSSASKLSLTWYW